MHTPIHEYFDLSSLLAIREQIQAESRPDDMARLVKHAMADFRMETLDERAGKDIARSFKHAADGWTDSIREQVAQFAVWARKVALLEAGGKDAPEIPYLLTRIENYLEQGPYLSLSADRLLQKMDRAGQASWEWFSALENEGITHMGELLARTEEQAFACYPTEYDDVKNIVQMTINLLMRRDHLYFSYWKGDPILNPARSPQPGLTQTS